jgi:hypothetical protein
MQDGLLASKSSAECANEKEGRGPVVFIIMYHDKICPYQRPA